MGKNGRKNKQKTSKLRILFYCAVVLIALICVLIITGILMTKIWIREDFERFERVRKDLQIIKEDLSRNDAGQWQVENSCDYPGQVFPSQPFCTIALIGNMKEPNNLQEEDRHIQNIIQKGTIEKYSGPEVAGSGYRHIATRMICQVRGGKYFIFTCFDKASTTHYQLGKPY